MIVLHYWYTAGVRGLISTSVSSPDSVSDSLIPSSFLAVLRSPRVIASSRGPGSLIAASAPLEEQEQFTVNKQHTKQHPSATASSTNSRQLSGHLSPARSKLSPVTCQNSGVCRWNEYAMGKSAGKLESSQKQSCNMLTQICGILKVLCPTFLYLHTHTYSTMSVRCATELAVSVCTRSVICSCTGEGRQKNMPPTEAEPWTYARMGLCEVTKLQWISCMLQLLRNCQFINQSS